MSYTSEIEARRVAVEMIKSMPGIWSDETYSSHLSPNWSPRISLNKYCFIDQSSETEYVCFISIYGKKETSVVSAGGQTAISAYLSAHSDFVNKLKLYIEAENQMLKDIGVKTKGSMH